MPTTRRVHKGIKFHCKQVSYSDDEALLQHTMLHFKLPPLRVYLLHMILLERCCIIPEWLITNKQKKGRTKMERKCMCTYCISDIKSHGYKVLVGDWIDKPCYYCGEEEDVHECEEEQ